MRRTLLVLLFSATTVGAQTEVVPRNGLVISASTRIRPGAYDLKAPSDSNAALIVVRGSNIDVDLAGVWLLGARSGSAPDAGAGIAILVDGGENVTIRGASIQGYKIAILARGTKNLRLIDNNLSRNWKPRLFSIVEHESLADWLSFHQNEKREWMRHGAAIYLEDVRGGEVRGNTVREGMNGLLMTRTDSLLVWNNDFSFNSGLGIGMYRSDHNRVMHNNVDFNVRGYSEGFYRRGQDSAGILIYQQSDSNVVAHNSVTHGGDGFFLWAGQHTMDTGQGGANDNIVHNNDFSWAPTNGIEATFSRNYFTENRIVGSDHGVWAGYSYDSYFYNNSFSRNRIGIAIEHGQNNHISGNSFDGDTTAIWLWANRIEPSDWGYPKHRDTRSLNPDIQGNNFRRVRTALRIADTHGGRIIRNLVIADSFLVVRGDTSGIRIDANNLAPGGLVNGGGRLNEWLRPVPLPGGKQVRPSPYADWPRWTIVVDEWGPYEWRGSRLWPVDSSLASPLRLRVLGPALLASWLPDDARRTEILRYAGWRLVSIRGARADRDAGRTGDTITITPIPGPVEDWTVSLIFDHPDSVRPRPISYSRFDPKATWELKVYAWTDSATHPIEKSAAFADLLRGLRGPPAFSVTTRRLDYVWYRPPARVQGWPQERAGVVATTRVNLPAGSYAIRTISDDGIRVFVDGKLVHEDWSIHESRVHEAPLSGGAHDIRVEYFQRDGWTELRAEVIKR